MPHAREQLWLFALVPESLEKERVEFVPLALLDSVESSEVSYPSVALSLDQVHIAYTYKRAYIKSLVLSKSALVRQAQEVLKRKTQAVDCREQTDLESTFKQNNPASTAPTPSSRDFRKEVVAIHKSAQADSRNAFFANAKCMDCRADKSARNDNQNAASEKADSSNDYSAPAEYMDCHADFQSARNDRNNATFKKVDSRENAKNVSKQPKDSRIFDTNTPSKKVDSRSEAQNLKTPAKDSKIFTQNAPILNTPQAEANLDSSKSPCDSKILDEKCGLQGKSQGSYLDGNDRRDFSPLPHFSLKAESPQANAQKGAR